MKKTPASPSTGTCNRSVTEDLFRHRIDKMEQAVQNMQASEKKRDIQIQKAITQLNMTLATYLRQQQQQMVDLVQGILTPKTEEGETFTEILHDIDGMETEVTGDVAMNDSVDKRLVKDILTQEKMKVQKSEWLVREDTDDDDILSVGDNGRHKNKDVKQKIRFGQRERSCLKHGRFLNDLVVNYLLYDINETSEKILIVPSNLFANIPT